MDVRTTQPRRPKHSPNSRIHDGFYVRVATGFGAMGETHNSEDSELYDGKIEGDIAAFGTVSEIALGGTVGRGLVLGGGIYTMEFVAVTAKLDDPDGPPLPAELDPTERHIALIGPFLDWYVRPRNGFHLQAALGLMILSASDISSFDTKANEDAYAAGGVGLMLGVGNEWWVADELSIGVMGRLTAGFVTGQDDDDVRWYHGVYSAPSVLATLTYH